MMKRRTFLGGALTATGAGSFGAQSATAQAVIQKPAEPLVWPVVMKLPPGIRSFSGHTDTVPDIVGRIGTAASLVIFTEGNHLMVLLSDDIIGAFPSWAKSQPQYADLDLDNILVVTVPQPVVVQMMRTGGIALGNLVLDVSRKSGFYPDIVMAGPDPLREVRKLGAIDPQGRFFSTESRLRAACSQRQSIRNSWPPRCRAHRGADCAAGGRQRTRGSRQVPCCRRRSDRKAGSRRALCRRGAALSRSHRHCASRSSRDGGPRLRGRGPHAVSPCFLLDADIPKPLRARTRVGRRAVLCKDRLWPRRRSATPPGPQGFDEFFFSRARDVYPRYDFARMSDDEYGATLGLD